MDEKKDRAGGLLRKDLLLLGAFLLPAWGINGFVFLQAVRLAAGGARLALALSFAAAMLALSATAAAVAGHLRRGGRAVYEGEFSDCGDCGEASHEA